MAVFALLFVVMLCCVKGDEKKRVICFENYHVNERGTVVATYDQADYAEQLLGVTSKILMPDIPAAHNGASLAKFQARFGENAVFYKTDPVVVEGDVWPTMPGPNFPAECKRFGCDFVLLQKSGERSSFPRYPEGFNSSLVRAGVQAVFNYEYHDDSIPYAGISTDVTKNVPGRHVVPYIVRHPSPEFSTMKGSREELNISKNAFVLCRHGGMDSFNVPFAQQTVFKLLDRYNKSQWEFIFLNTNKLVRKTGPHNPVINADYQSQIHYLPGNADLKCKDNFIATCDAMLHERDIGETYGLAVAEFSVRNKPVITFPGKSREHIRILGDKGFVFNNAEELIQIVDNFVLNGVDKTRDYNAYREYSPENVMAQFKKVYLDPIFGA